MRANLVTPEIGVEWPANDLMHIRNGSDKGWHPKALAIGGGMTAGVRTAIIGVFCLVLAGCGNVLAGMYGIPIIAPTDYADVRSHMDVENDPYEGVIKITGPVIFHDRSLGGHTYAVRGWIDPDNATLSQLTQIYVTGRFTDWAFLDRAHAAGERLPTSQIDRDVGNCGTYGCTLSETIGINLTPQQLAAAVANGMDFKVSGRSGSLTMAIPSTYFRAYRDAYEEAKASI